MAIEENRVNEDLCSEFGISCREKAPSLQASLLDVAGLSELFKAMADETRIKILHLLAQEELCVCDLAYLLESSFPRSRTICGSCAASTSSAGGGTASRYSTPWPTSMFHSCLRSPEAIISKSFSEAS
jgi:DNA-binding transcriptional ArsR family regulator